MPKINVVKKAMKDQGKCGRCGVEIKKGMPYRWWCFNFSKVRHIRCESCNIRSSELTSSDKLSRLYAVQENADDACSNVSNPTTKEGFIETISNLIDELRSYCDEIHEVAEEYNESAENIESGFNHETAMSEELREKSENVESWADEVESFLDNNDPEDMISEFEDEEGKEVIENKNDKETLEDFLVRKFEDFIGEVNNVFSNCPL